MKQATIGFMIIVAALVLAACGGQQTQEAQVSSGQEVYQAECARCHDPGGIGPALSANVLGQRGNAKTLHTYVSSTMPQDKPGQLSDQEYWDVTAYIVSQAGLLPADTVLADDTAEGVALK